MNTKQIPSVILNDLDPSPTENSLIHPYPGSMPAYLASRLIERYSSVGDNIFDPFCGSGSVIIEAAKLGRNVYGTDLLKTAIDIANTALHLPSPERLKALWGEVYEKALYRTSIFQSKGETLEDLPDSLKKLSHWFHKETFEDILSIREEISEIKNHEERQLLMLILAGSLISLSKRVSRGVTHWGWIADNVKPHPDDLLRTDPYQELNRRVHKLIVFMSATGSYNLLSAVKSKLFEYNWLDKKQTEKVLPNPINLLITSPPYPYSIDYTLALRLTHYLLDHEYEILRNREIGARYKRKRKARGDQYLQELTMALGRSTLQVAKDGLAVFVLHNPAEYMNVISMTHEDWSKYLINSMSGDWDYLEFGFRRCVQRRLINANQKERSEFIAVFKRK